MKDNGKTISLLVDRITLLEEIEHLRYERDEARDWARRFYKALDDISLIALDYDGYRSASGLMELIDELRHIAGKAITGK
jgi:hypothetical protein